VSVFKLIAFLLFFVTVSSYSQEITLSTSEEKKALTHILDLFQNQHQFSFSYDVEGIKNVLLDIQELNIHITDLQNIIKNQTTYELQKISETDYILYDSIRISYFGYRHKTIKISDFTSHTCDTIRLQPEIQSLGQVLVKEYLTGGIQKNQDGSVNISTKKMRILPGLVEPDVLQSLQLLPGINSPTEDPAGLYIRGGTPGQNLVLWDGIKMYQSGHFFNQISTFNPFITKNVQVYRGGTSVRYGDRISGVVVIESDDDLTEKVKAGGGINLTHGDLYLKLPLSKKMGVMLAGRRSTTDLYQNIAYNNLARKVFQNTRASIPDAGDNEIPGLQSREDDFSFSDLNFKMIWNPNDDNIIKLSSIFAENRLDNKQNTGIVANNNRVETQDILKLRNVGTSLNWDKNYTASTHQNVNVYMSVYDQRYNFLLKVTDEFAPGIEDRLIYNAVLDVGAEYSIHFPVGNNKSLNLGYQFSYNETNYETEFDFSGDDLETELFSLTGNGTNHTLYSEYKYKTPKTFLNLGFRASQLSNVNSFFLEPRIFASYELFKNFTLNTSAELKNQQLNNYLTYTSSFGLVPTLPVSDNVWILSDNSSLDGIPPIRVLRSSQFTLGGLYSYQGWHFDLEGYYKKINDVSSLSDLVLDLASPEGNDSLIFYGEEERIGFDFLIKKRFQNYRFWAGYSLSKTIATFPLVQDSYFDGNFDQRHVFNLSQTLKVKDFEFALGWNYATGRPFTRIIPTPNDFGATIDPRGINSSRFKDYHRLDASVVYRFDSGEAKKNWNGLIGFSLRNLYNRKNVISQGFREINTQNSPLSVLEGFQNESLRLTPDFVVRFNF